MIGRLLLAALLAVAAPAAAAPAPTARAAASDWVRHVERTAEGGYRMGNPSAAMKLVEYGSVTCPHCAEFAETADAPLRRLVATGRVSFEYRPFAIFPSDPGLFALLDCQGPGKFFDTLGRLYAGQETWRAKVEAREGSYRGLSGPALAAAATRDAGVAAMFTLTPARAAACLADAEVYRRLEAQGRAAERVGVQGTPTFLLNGRMIQPRDWADLERMLSAG